MTTVQFDFVTIKKVMLTFTHFE